MIKVTSWNLAFWVRWLGLATLLLALAGLGLSFINATMAQMLAIGLAIFISRLALVEAVLGVVAGWQRRRWVWVVALGLAGIATLLCGPLSNAVNSNAPYIIVPIFVGALGLASAGLPHLPRAASASAR